MAPKRILTTAVLLRQVGTLLVVLIRLLAHALILAATSSWCGHWSVVSVSLCFLVLVSVSADDPYCELVYDDFIS